ncbi:phosphohistidine phosphatase SixA [Marivirga atlantica]|jgi:phosphohistidine phosphatase|uniref:Histidine phosphatase family protein n=1 Tax=Marivirga atlantica TaxID=1548457 RepID=A0A937AMA7_9BACT|nr:histidine phosphatase family protein [Marivirga atlantica]MBL0765297.1 histidine phosphatase family protein [Marivirga atlantica]
MVKNLYLIRHAQAEEHTADKKDVERQLTSKGYQDASKIGVWFKEKGIHPDIIVHSFSKRTTETVERLNEQLGVDPDHIESSEEIYEASARILLKVITEIPAEMRSAFIVGHNPSISYLSEYVTGAEIGHVQTAGIVHIQVPFTSWQEVSEKNCDFIDYIAPKDIS